MPTPAKVAKPKKPSKKQSIGAAVVKRVGEKLSRPSAETPEPQSDTKPEVANKERRSLVKPPYNHRVRSLCRSIVDQVESEEDRKKVRLDLRDLTSLAEVTAYVDANVGEGQMTEILNGWFAAGILGEKKE